MPSATASTERVNSSREPVRATSVSSQGTTRRPTRMIAMAAKAATLPSVTSTERRHAKLLPAVERPRRRVPPSTPAKGRQQHQRQHHGEVLDDQPADRDAAALER